VTTKLSFNQISSPCFNSDRTEQEAGGNGAGFDVSAQPNGSRGENSSSYSSSPSSLAYKLPIPLTSCPLSSSSSAPLHPAPLPLLEDNTVEGSTIHPQHSKELAASAIDPQIAELNFVSLKGVAPYDYLFYSDGIKRLNTGRLPTWILKKYSHIELGGWWSSGIDPITGEEELWGCFKANQPRLDPTKGKYQKYEHPLKAVATLFALRVSLNIWHKVSQRYSVPLPDLVVVDDKGEALGFWAWVIANPKVAVILTEGVKKAASLLSQGFAAIGLPGIWGGYRKNDGQPSLLPQLEVFARDGRQVYFAFDQDEKPKTRLTTRKALYSTARLIIEKGCLVSIINWSPWIKGCDDLIVAKGADHFVERYEKALSFEDWQADRLYELSYKPALTLDSSTKYIGDFAPPPSAKLICLKAPKGSGKTEWLVKVCAKAQSIGQKVLVITHRQQLGQALCSRFGIDYVSELKNSDTKGVFGYGLCFDSLRPNSKARFNPDDWHNCIVILDECEQSIWHLLNARTEVAKHRVEVLRTFQELIQNILESEQGKVYLSDADLSDLSINYVRSLVNFPIEPWIAIKEGNPTPWNITVWETCNELLGALTSHIRMGGRPFIFVDGQKAKSKWGTQNLEAYLSQLFPDKRILRIDAESIAEPNHPAFGCIDNLNEVLPLYDIILASPSIETGVSIDITGHITSVWDIAQGVIPVPSVLQRLSRVRESVPRHVWAASYGIGSIGNGSTSPRSLMASQKTQFNAHIKLLAESEIPVDFSQACSFQPQSTRTWVLMAARINFGMIRYRHEIIRALMAEGHSVHGGDYLAVLNDDEDAHGTKQIKDELTESRDKIYQAHCVAISTSPNPDDKQYKTLAKKSCRTVQENASLRKGELSRRYSEELVSSKLVELDDKGEYYKAQLHYYFTKGREFLPSRDKQVIERQMAAGSGYIFVPDANRSLIGGKIKLLEALGINRLLQPDTEWTNDSEILIDLSIKCHQYAQLIKSLWGISIKKDDSPVLIAQKILRHCLGLSFASPIKRGAKGNQQRFYQAVEISSLRQSIIETWYLRDKEVKLAQDTAKVALDKRGFPSSLPPATHSNDTGVGSMDLSLDSDVEVGSTGNINTIPVVPTESAAYQDAAHGTVLEQLVEALPFCETADDLASVIEGYAIEAVEDAIAMQDTQPRRLQLTKWLANVTTEPKPIEPVLPSFKVGDALERLRGYSKGQVAKVLQVFQDWLETSLGAVSFNEIESGSWLLIGST
jgi:hypothetical protein